MMRLVIYLLTIALVAAGLAWLADRPGTLQVAWQGYDIETTVFRAAVILAAIIATAIFLWSLARALWNSPATIGRRILDRRQKRGLEALSSGLIAVGAGDGVLAARYALMARKSLPHEPLTHLLRARAAELSGDKATARRIYEAMLSSPETEQLGLRGLYLEAKSEGADEAAGQYASRALEANPKLGWSADARFDQQCKQRDWSGALETLNHMRRTAQITKVDGDRKRAVLLTAKALELEEIEGDKALAYALEAHSVAPDLVPAAVVAGRILAGRGQTAKAAKVLQKTWVKAPHPDLALVYAHARIGDSTRDRLDRVRQLAALSPHSIESPIAVATTAIEARLFDEARKVLEPLLADRLTQRVAILMARLEAGENGTQGRVREWLARAATAARDPVWLADGVISDHWEAISPVDGRLDAYQWRVPVEARDEARAEIVANRLEELLAIEAADEPRTVSGKETATFRSPPAPRDGNGPIASPQQPTDEVDGVPDTRDEASTEIVDLSPSVEEKPNARVASEEPVRTGRQDPTIFVNPRAPDDPGTEGPELELEQPVARRSFRVSN